MSDSGATSGYALARDGVRLHHLDYAGPDPALVIIPGITSPAATWEFMALPLSADRRVVVLDTRGRGLSDKPSTGYTLVQYSDDVAATVEQLGLVRPIVLGHSMGARIAAAFGRRHPEAAGPLVIVDPPLTGPGRAEYPIPLATFEQQIRDAVAGATADDMSAAYGHWGREHLLLREKWLRTCDETAVRESWKAFHDEDFFPYLADLTGDVLFVYGKRSPVVPAAALDELRSLNPRMELVGVPDAGHMIPWENADGFLAAVRPFLARA